MVMALPPAAPLVRLAARALKGRNSEPREFRHGGSGGTVSHIAVKAKNAGNW
jgi:hypothetical protein